MKPTLTVACIQTNAAPDIETNLKRIEPMVRQAAADGAQFIALPENVSLMVLGREKLFAAARVEADHPALPFFRSLAKETGTWIMTGSLSVVLDGDCLANRCYVVNPDGTITAHYDKIHMFDADVGANESYRESNNFRAGDRAVVTDTPWGKLGLTICYDMRFPHLYRDLAKAGAGIITVPAAFTVPTGQAHWHVLLRARAIEIGCFILAPAQCGEHDGGRKTYGHSLIIDPWGTIMAEAEDAPQIIMAKLDLSLIDEVRRKVPSLQHDRDYSAANS